MEYSAKYFIELLENYKASKNYTKNKDNIEQIAIEYSNNNDFSISWNELYIIQDFFYKFGKRYGLLKIFRENGIC